MYYRNYLGTLPLLLSPKHGLLKTLTLWLINLSADGFEIPVSGTLSTVFQTRDKFGQNIYPPSVKFTQCQTVLRTAVKSSPNEPLTNSGSLPITILIFNMMFISLLNKY